MRTIAFVAIAAIFFLGCNKDKFTTVPQLKYKSVNPNNYKQGILNPATTPVIKISVTDAEGDLGFIDGSDTSFIYIKNLRTGNFDSAALPDISKSATKKFEADIDLNMFPYLRVPNNTKKDTLYFEIYIKDFAKNKSNVIRNDDPIYYTP